MATDTHRGDGEFGPLDLAPLLAEPTKAEVDEWRRDMATKPLDWSRSGTAGAYVAAVLVPLVLGLVTIPIFGRAVSSSSDGGSASVLPSVLAVIGVGIALAFVGVTLWARARRVRWLRIDRFARANGMTFEPSGGSPPYSGMVFDVGSSRLIGEHVTNAAGGRFFDYGTYRYTTGSGKSRRTHDWGYLAFRLDRQLPQMVLDARANDGILSSNLPALFNRDQRLSLEGDFDRYFTLYCPREYERDALYVFTPDLMALLIDEVSAFDVEVVDDWMFVYSTVPFALGDAAVHERMFQIMRTVGTKTVRQTQRYADDRVPNARMANIVAPAGRRLRRRVPIGLIIGFVAFVAFIFYVQVAR